VSSPSVYIVILNWNGLDDTLECLASIAKLSYSNVKTIVVDNGSEDDQAAVIAEAFPNITVLAQPENLGFCGGCNVGIKEALEKNADFVMLLNNDTLVSPDLIESILDGISGIEKIGAVSPLILNYPQTDKVWFAKAQWIPERAEFSLDPEQRDVDELLGKDPYRSLFACGCCLVAPADVFRSEGLLDERYFAFFDEAEWCFRIRRKGLESYVVPSAVVYHKGSQSTPSSVAGYLMTRNRMLWMKENLTFGLRLKSLSYLLRDIFGNLANILGLTKEHQSRQYSRAVILGYRDYFLRKFYKWDKSAEATLFDS